MPGLEQIPVGPFNFTLIIRQRAKNIDQKAVHWSLITWFLPEGGGKEDSDGILGKISSSDN